jgi:hypothetical protein
MGIANGVPVLLAIYGESGVDHAIARTCGAGSRANRSDLSTPAAGPAMARRNPSQPDTWWCDVSTTPLALPWPTLALSLTCVDVDGFRTRAMRWL